VGALFISLPAGDGGFAGLMPFSYIGCSGGLSVGAIAGTRSGDNLGGTWAGTLDGASVGGGFTATAVDGAAPVRFDGSFSNSNGKQSISAGPCNYFMAAQGRFRVFAGPASEPAGVSLAVANGSTAPVLSWTGVPAGATSTLRLFDEACLESTPSAGSCFLGEAATSGSSFSFPAGFAGAQPLTVGGRYLVLLTAQTASTGSGAGIAAFASTRYTPTSTAAAAAAPPAGGGGAGSGLGQLTLSGSPSATAFVPSSLPLGAPETDGPTCFGSGATAACGSSWITAWAEGASALLSVIVASSSLGAPGPAPGSRIDLLTVQYIDLANSRQYRYICGQAPAPACDAAVHGVALDTAARRVRFSGAVLPEFTVGGTGSVTLNGELRW